MEWWELPYNTIRALNEFIQRVPGSPVAEELKNERVAEARFLRAYNYFAMVKRYGGVPLITVPQALDEPWRSCIQAVTRSRRFMTLFFQKWMIL